MLKTSFVFLSLSLLLAACSPQPKASSAPRPTMTVTLMALPTVTKSPEPGSTATDGIDGSIFSKISHSTDTLHLKCDPLELIFDVTIRNPDVNGVLFFFRMKDKATGLVNGWSNGENMRSVGNGIFEFIFRASAIPGNARYKDAWVQYQFVGIDKSLRNIGRSQIFEEDITFTPNCP
jgi:hypothetical protein